MKIAETLDFFKNLKNVTTDKSEIKLYDKYIAILLDLNNRDLTQTQVLSIETELDSLNLKSEPDNRIKYFKKKLAEFQQFLKDKLSLVSEGYYTGIGVGTGLLVGSIFSMLFYSFLGAYSILIGINVGMILGSVIGSIRDAEAVKQGRVFTTKLKSY
jgi:hypothetical protein